jgi:hypothetical protein
MRSTLNVRICHLLRVMRVVAPVEWNLGLPFPSSLAMANADRAIELPEEVSFASWLESLARSRRSASADGTARRLAA